jgi:DNA primase
VAPLLVLVADPVERGEHERQLALAIGVAAEEVRALVRRQAAKQRGVAEEPEREEPAAVRAAAAVQGPEPRERAWAKQVLRQWLDHPELAREVDAEELAALFPHPPFDRLLPAVAELCDAEEAVDVEALAALLDEASAAALRAIAMEDAEPLELGRARSLQEETLARLRQRRLREESRQHTRRFLTGEIPDDALLAEKQRVLEEKRRAMGLVPGPAR